jgi:hypothetical protein
MPPGSQVNTQHTIEPSCSGGNRLARLFRYHCKDLPWHLNPLLEQKLKQKKYPQEYNRNIWLRYNEHNQQVTIIATDKELPDSPLPPRTIIIGHPVAALTGKRECIWTVEPSARLLSISNLFEVSIACVQT